MSVSFGIYSEWHFIFGFFISLSYFDMSQFGFLELNFFFRLELLSHSPKGLPKGLFPEMHSFPFLGGLLRVERGKKIPEWQT